MKLSLNKIKNLLYVVMLFSQVKLYAQAGVGPAPYCFPLYNQIPCNQPGPSNTAGNFINDFINSFSTSGAVVNITNNNSGCNAQNFAGIGIRNYFFFGCSQYLVVNPGQNITCTFQSGNVYPQGFTCFIDWNQDGVYNLTTERVCSIPGVPAAASFNNASFVVPATQAAGIYRMRVRCAYSNAGPTIDPCINYGFGETEEYNVYVSMSPPGVITATAVSITSTSLCSGQTISLTANSSAASSVALTYTWSGPSSYTSNLQSPIIASATSSNSGVYSVTVSPGSCPAISTIAITVVDYPTYTLTPLTATVCQGGVFTPSVSFGVVLPGTPCSTLGVGPACANPNIITLGNGASTNALFGYPSPYAKWWNDAHQQFLYQASELTAMGVSMGYITSLAFNVTNLNGAGNFPGYTIKIKCTPNTQVTAFDNTGLTTVFSGAFAPVNGWNTHNFVTPYYWDGVSNLLVDICFSNGPFSTNVSSPFTTTAFTSCIWNFAIGAGSTCGTSASAGMSSNRPNTRFGNCGTINPNNYSYLWSPGPGIAAPTASTTGITTQPITGSISTAVYSVAVTPTVFSCPIIQTLTVTIINPLSPTITPVSPICNTSGTIGITVSPAGGTFSNNPAISSSGVITPSLAAIGTSTVLYTVGVGSCIATNTAVIDVSQFNTAALTGTLANMCNTFTPTNLLSIVLNTVSGVWSGSGVTTNTFSPNLPTGVYTLTYNTSSIPNPTVCPDTQTINVSVLNPAQPTISVVGPYCNTAPNFQLSVSPNTGTWTTTMYNIAGTFLPYLASIGSNTVQYTIGTSTCSVQDTKTISIEAFVPAIITGGIPSLCNTSMPVNLTPITSNTLGIWSGAGIVGTVFNPSVSGAGNFVITYNTASSPSSLCPAQATTAVSVYSLALPTIKKVGSFCNSGAPVQLQVSPLGGVFGGVNNLAVTPQGQFYPAFATIGDNLVNYSVTSGPCIAIAQTTVTIEKFISADLSQYAGPFCKNDGAINLNSIVQNPGGSWSGPGLMGSMFTPANANIGSNNILIYSTHSMPTASLCPDTAAIRLQVNDIPFVTVIGSKASGCAPLEVVFNSPSINAGAGLWNLGDGTEAQTGLYLTHLYTTPGTYTVSFDYIDEIGCSAYAVLPNPITVYEMPKAIFSYGPSEISIANPEVQFTNSSTVLGNNTYQWQISNLFQTDEINPKVIFPKTGDYEITLTATTLNGCKDVVSKILQVKNEFGIYIPTVFTPNYDGLNDVFMPVFSQYGIDAKGFTMEIFDRWGEQVFSTKDITVGWDGTRKNRGGDALKEDVYVYKIKFKDNEGKIYNKAGHITLIK